MRVLTILSFLLAAPVHAAPPCPKGLPEKLIQEYPNAEANGRRVQISACVWGNFAGPGWMVYHVTPWGPHSKAEVGPDGGRVLVRKDGTFGAAEFGEGLEHVEPRAVDLDGDGVDELVAVVTWSSIMSPESGQQLVVSRVKGDKIEDLASIQISYEADMPDGNVSCKGTLEVKDAGKGTRRLVVTAKAKGSRELVRGCLAPGRHIYALAGGTVTETPTMQTLVITDPTQLDAAVGQVVTLRGTVVKSKIPTLLGVDVASDDPDLRGEDATASGRLEKETVTQADLDKLIAQHGQVAHRGPGVYYRLVDPASKELAQVKKP